MSADIATDDLAPDPEAELAAVIAALGRTPSTEELHNLSEAMHRLGIDFRAAALHLGLLHRTIPMERAEPAAPELVESPAEQSRTSLVQIALRKISASRALVVKEGIPVRAGKNIP